MSLPINMEIENVQWIKKGLCEHKLNDNDFFFLIEANHKIREHDGSICGQVTVKKEYFCYYFLVGQSKIMYTHHIVWVEHVLRRSSNVSFYVKCYIKAIII